jgi:hypothetical protein
MEKIKDWIKNFKGIKQFKVLERDKVGVITKVLRLNDSSVFALEVFYPGLRYEFLTFTEFKEDLSSVIFNYFSNDKLYGCGVCTINDVFYETQKEDGRSGYTDKLTEKSRKELSELGMEFDGYTFTLKK